MSSCSCKKYLSVTNMVVMLLELAPHDWGFHCVPGNANMYSRVPNHVFLEDSLHDPVSWGRSS